MNYYLICGNYYLCFRKNGESKPVQGLFWRYSKNGGIPTKSLPDTVSVKVLRSDNCPRWNKSLKPGVTAPGFFHIHVNPIFFTGHRSKYSIEWEIKRFFVDVYLQR